MAAASFNQAGALPSGWIVAYCDGGSRGNPGPSGFGVVIQNAEGKILAELSEYLGRRTNNFAEYSGLIAALEFAKKNGHPCLRVISDSELMVKQMNGQYRVNSPDLRPLFEQARGLASALNRFEISHVLRGKNQHADRLANQAMDRTSGRSASQGGTRPQPASSPSAPPHGASGQEAKMLRGVVQGGVVHLLGDDLPDGVFVKVIPE